MNDSLKSFRRTQERHIYCRFDQISERYIPCSINMVSEATLSIYMLLNTYLDVYMSIMHVFRRIPAIFFVDVLTLHTPYSGTLVSGGVALVDPRL